MISGQNRSGRRLRTALQWVALTVLTAAVVASGVGLYLTWPRDAKPVAAPVASPSASATVDPQSLVSSAQTLPEDELPESPIDTAWEDKVSARSGISVVAVRAYGAAVLKLSKDQPQCKLGWTTLAGIGAVESGHGTNGGSSLAADGQTTRKIIGPALDGTGGNAAIAADPAFEKYHGDSKWDHAMGPMQFISSTWARWGSDGNDDGEKDPSNIFDAAYAAGRYLCAEGTDLTQGSNWGQAIFSYNHSADYVASVYYRAREYASAG